MFQSYAEWEMKMIEEGRMQAANPMTEKMVEDIRDYAERARYTPTRTKPILSIIYEEAGSYFAGDKPIEEVIDLIQNRVQVYLNEMTLGGRKKIKSLADRFPDLTDRTPSVRHIVP